MASLLTRVAMIYSRQQDALSFPVKCGLRSASLYQGRVTSANRDKDNFIVKKENLIYGEVGLHPWRTHSQFSNRKENLCHQENLSKKRWWGVVLISLSLLSQSAQAAVLVNAMESGSDVIFSGGGTLNTSGVFQGTNLPGLRGINPIGGVLRFTPSSSSVTTSTYSGLSGPASFCTSPNVFISASSSSGDIFGLIPSINRFITPVGYVSGTPLTGSMTFANATFATLGLTEGTYVWNWGTGANADTFTLNIASSVVPEPLTILGAATAAGLGAAFKCRSNKENKK